MNIALQAPGIRPTPPKRRHLLIAGTGRAGTSFLVRFLTDLGLETHISRFGENPWHEVAQAGLEDLPPALSFEDLPYLFKTPWAYQFIEEMLADPAIEIEAVILPMRDLAEAAASRSIVELQAIYERAPWMARLAATWEDFGITPGGAVFSLNPVDQSRLMAAGFHRLVNCLVQAEIPLIFIAFPRMVQDADYLFAQLRPFVPPTVTLEQARQSHRRIADASLARVGRELRGETECPGTERPGTEHRAVASAAAVPTMPPLEDLDKIALRREVDRLRAQLAATEAARMTLARSQLFRRVFNRCRREFATWRISRRLRWRQTCNSTFSRLAPSPGPGSESGSRRRATADRASRFPPAPRPR